MAVGSIIDSICVVNAGGPDAFGQYNTKQEMHDSIQPPVLTRPFLPNEWAHTVCAQSMWVTPFQFEKTKLASHDTVSVMISRILKREYAKTYFTPYLIKLIGVQASYFQNYQKKLSGCCTIYHVFSNSVKVIQGKNVIG